jgi:alkanesulfonate monooxygenase SsuD/methylene tetrahydromethanopterin reductase-like flavin-dependent oxidoreductase (luciferase family)
VLDRWRDQTRAAGRDPDNYRIGIIRNVFVTDDKERDWPPLRDAERYRMAVYSRFFEEAGLTGRAATFTEADRIPQRTIVGDVDHCVEELVNFIREYGLTDVVSWGSAPGVQPATMTPMMERLATEVAPRVRAIIEG